MEIDMDRSRTGNSIRNISFALIGQLLTTIISFTSRTVFVRVLGKEYLGIAGLFGNILSILALAELGIGAAIIFSLYKPLAENNIYKIQALMKLYKKTYTMVGLTILIVGCSLTPRLDLFVSEIPDIPNFRLIYILYVVNNASAYFFSYKAALINADQKQYLTTTIQNTSSFLMNVVQIIILIVTKNYILYLLTMLLFTFGRNIMITLLANRMYPYLKQRNNAQLEDEEKRIIINNVKAMMMHKVGGIVVDSTDNILLSKLVSIAVVGMYSNYYLITNTLATVYNMLFNSLVSSVGNLGAMENKEKIYENFKFIDFAGTWIYTFSFVCLFNLFNPFIRVWIGEDYLFAFPMVFVISINFYLTGMRNSVLTFRSALGLFWYDRYKAVGEAVVNLVVSIVLGLKYGAIGIFIGTATSTVLLCLTVEPYITFKYGFGMKATQYYIQYLKNLLIALGIAVGIRMIGKTLPDHMYINLLLNAILCIILPNGILWLLYRRKKEYIKMVSVFKRKILHI